MIRPLIAGSAISTIIGFVSLFAMARLFSLEFISDAKSVTLIGGWVSLVLTFQVHSTFLYFFGKNPDKDQSFRVATIAITFVMAIVAAVVFYSIFDLLYEPTEISNLGMIAFSTQVGTNLLFNVSPAIFAALGDGIKLPRFMASYAFAPLLTLCVSYIFSFDINQYALLLMILSLASVFASKWFGYILHALRKGLVFALKGYSRHHIRHSLKISLSIFFESIAEKADKFLVAKLYEPIVFAKYSVLNFENPLVGFLLNSHGLAIVREFQRGASTEEERFSTYWADLVGKVSLFTFPSSLFLAYHGTWFISLMFGEKFLDYTAILQVYLLTTIIRYAPFQALLRMEGIISKNIVCAILFAASILATIAYIYINQIDSTFLAVGYFVGWFSFNSAACYFFVRRTHISLKLVLAPSVWLSRVVQVGLSIGLAEIITSNIWANAAIFSLAYITINFTFDRQARAWMEIEWVRLKAIVTAVSAKF